MAYLTIITQTFGFDDSYGYFAAAVMKAAKTLLCYNINGISFKKRRFDRVVITKDGHVIFLPPVIKHYAKSNVYEVDQWMGAGKSIVGLEHLARVHRNGGRIMANMAIGYMEHNKGLPKEKWTSNIVCLDDLKEATNCTMLIDDFKKVVARWQCKEAEFISMVANESRKDKKDILITSQRVVNFIPKDIREVCTNYEIPYCTIRDQRVESPDGMGMPVEMEVFNISATGTFLGFGLWNGMFPDGKVLMPTKKMLDQYSTLEIVTDLKQEGARPNQEGYAEEVRIKDHISKRIPGVYISHLNGKDKFDLLVGGKLALDVKKNTDGKLQIKGNKTVWEEKLRDASVNGWDPYISYETNRGVFGTRIKKDLPTSDIELSSPLMFRRMIPIENILKRMFPSNFV